jgi:hypothetical protein
MNPRTQMPAPELADGTLPNLARMKTSCWHIGKVVTLAILFGGVSAMLGQTIFEAKDATLAGPSIATQYAGYTGSGYADYNNASADYVEFNLNASSTGSYPIAFRYANGGTTGSRRSWFNRVDLMATLVVPAANPPVLCKAESDLVGGRRFFTRNPPPRPSRSLTTASTMWRAFDA